MPVAMHPFVWGHYVDYIYDFIHLQIKNNAQGQTALEEIKKFEKIEAHANVVRMHDFHYGDSAFWMVMEFCDLGDLEGDIYFMIV